MMLISTILHGGDQCSPDVSNLTNSSMGNEAIRWWSSCQLPREQAVLNDFLVKLDDEIEFCRAMNHVVVKRFAKKGGILFPVYRESPYHALRLAANRHDWLFETHLAALSNWSLQPEDDWCWSLVSGLSYAQLYGILHRLYTMMKWCQFYDKTKVIEEVVSRRINRLYHWIARQLWLDCHAQKHLRLAIAVYQQPGSQWGCQLGDDHGWALNLSLYHWAYGRLYWLHTSHINGAHVLNGGNVYLYRHKNNWLILYHLDLPAWFGDTRSLDWYCLLPWRWWLYNYVHFASAQRFRAWSAVSYCQRSQGEAMPTYGEAWIAVTHLQAWYDIEQLALDQVAQSWAFSLLPSPARFYRECQVYLHHQVRKTCLALISASPQWQIHTKQDYEHALQMLSDLLYWQSIDQGKMDASLDELIDVLSCRIHQHLDAIWKNYQDSPWCESQLSWECWYEHFDEWQVRLMLPESFNRRATSWHRLQAFMSSRHLGLSQPMLEVRAHAACGGELWDCGDSGLPPLCLLPVGQSDLADDDGEQAVTPAEVVYRKLVTMLSTAKAVSFDCQVMSDYVDQLVSLTVADAHWIVAIRDYIDSCSSLSREHIFLLRPLLSFSQKRFWWIEWVTERQQWGCFQTIGESIQIWWGQTDIDSCIDAGVCESDVLDVWYQQLSCCIEKNDAQALASWCGDSWAERALSHYQRCHTWSSQWVASISQESYAGWRDGSLPSSLRRMIELCGWCHSLENERPKEEGGLLFWDRRLAAWLPDLPTEEALNVLYPAWENWLNRAIVCMQQGADGSFFERHESLLQALANSPVVAWICAQGTVGDFCDKWFNLIKEMDSFRLQKKHLDEWCRWSYEIEAGKQPDQSPLLMQSLMNHAWWHARSNLWQGIWNQVHQQAKRLLYNRLESWFQGRWSGFIKHVYQPLTRLQLALPDRSMPIWCQDMECLIANQIRLAMITVSALNARDHDAQRCVAILSSWQVLREEECHLLRSKAVDIIGLSDKSFLVELGANHV